ncbi:hypothetical protein [Myroides sp. C4067]|uniref:hypothetical protein n=1 Tax=Myroides sp. C4067 TaxID=3136765 RepID=UPI0031015B3C
MSFKLLAIRPLEGTDPSLLKGLKPNCIYRFYNEYDYLYEYDENTGEGKSFIDYQDQYFKEVSNKEDNYLKLENKEIKVIKYNKQLPNDFFGKNINVSAVVGENGSGKSSLLELFYYFLFDFSRTRGILKQENTIQTVKKFKLELYCENGSKLIRVQYNSIGITVSHQYIYENNRYIMDDINTGDKIDFWQLCTRYDKEIGEHVGMLPFYNIALNYGVYGLNNSHEGYKWLKPLFHKNDGYQTPLVINPMRTYGNIDVNRELSLNLQRLIINYFVIGNKKLVSNISLDSIEYAINIYKHQFYKFTVDEEYKGFIYAEDVELKLSERKFSNEVIEKLAKNDLLVLNRFRNFLESCFEAENEIEALTEFCNTLRIMSSSKELDFDLFIDFYNEEIIEKKLNQFVLNRDKDVVNINELQYLNILYIFKKLGKITETYTEYKRFEYLFLDRKNEDIRSLLVNKLSDELKNSKDGVSSEVLYNVVYDSLLSLELFYHIENEKVYIDDRRKMIRNLVDDITLSVDSLEFYKSIVDELISLIDNRVKDDFLRFVERLKKDNSHIRFKLTQAIEYFSKDILKEMFVPDRGNIGFFDKETGFYHLNANSDYFLSKNNEGNLISIEKVPIAFFTFNIKVKKDGQEGSYPIKDLSSGEQQLINSLLSISYHLFNLKSIFDTQYNKIVYKIINIIMDEIELYFHPNYQREYIKELIEILSFFPDFQYNIMLSTHSPFILSDIPSQNVLKLKDGKPVAGDNINSFGANIHDLLADEFFLDKGFMGEFAKEKINEIFEKIEKISSIDIKKRDELFKEINLIGEDVIRIPLLAELEKKFKDTVSDKQSLIDYYQSKLDELKTN